MYDECFESGVAKRLTFLLDSLELIDLSGINEVKFIV